MVEKSRFVKIIHVRFAVIHVSIAVIHVCSAAVRVKPLLAAESHEYNQGSYNLQVASILWQRNFLSVFFLSGDCNTVPR